MKDQTPINKKISNAIAESYALLERSKNLKKVIKVVLQHLGQATKAGRTCVYKNNINLKGGISLSIISECYGEGISIEIENGNLFGEPYKNFPNLEDELRKDKIQNKLIGTSTNKNFVEMMMQQNLISSLYIPIFGNSTFWGFIEFDYCTKDDLFTPEELKALHLFASFLGNFIYTKKQFKIAIRSQKRYKRLISNIQDVIFQLDEEFNLQYIGGSWFHMTKKKIKHCIGQELGSFFVKDGREILLEAFKILRLKGESQFSFFTEFNIAKQENYYIRVNIKKVHKGNKIKFYGTINNANQDKINLDIIQESDLKFKALLDSEDAILYSRDGQTGQYLFFSDKIKNLGLKTKDFISDPGLWMGQIIPEDLPKVMQIFEEFIKSKKPIFEVEYRINKPNGQTVWVYDKAVSVHNSTNNSLLVYGRIFDITEKKNREVQLQQTENRFKIITENLPFPFILCREGDFKLLYYNFSFYESFQSNQIDGSELGNLWINQLIPVEDKVVFETFLSLNANFSNHEILLNSQNGQQWYSLSSQLIPYKMESVRAIVFYNINKRKLSELELIRMNDVIQAINQTQVDFSMDNEIQDTFYLLLNNLIQFTGSSFGFLGEILYDENGIPFLKSNAASNIEWNKEVGKNNQENFTVGSEFRNLNSIIEWVLNKKQLLIANELEYNLEANSHANDIGHPILKRFLGIPIFKGNQYIGMVGLANKEKPYSHEDVEFLKPFLNSYANLIVSLNVNRQKRSAELLQKESESLYRVLSENIDDIVTLHDLDFKTLYASPSLEKVTGFEWDQFINSNFFNFFEFKPKEKLDFTSFPRFIIPITHGKSGKKIKLEMLWKPIYTDKGELKSYLAASRDVTERELVLEELTKNLEKEIELNQLKSKFISMTSHELRTPLATIQSSTDLIEIIIAGIGNEIAQDGLMKQIRKIHLQLIRLTQIISDGLLSEKNSQGKIIYNQSDIDLNNLIIQLVFNQFSFSENKPKIKLDLVEETVMLKSDPALLFYVIRNLIENALKYTPKNFPKPILKMKPKENFVEIQFIDFGIGIPKEENKFLFEPFFRASNVKNIKGTGLGLSIVNDLVKKLGAHLTFSSKENQGSTFIITIPYERNDSVD